jgi:hypothetical protein
VSEPTQINVPGVVSRRLAIQWVMAAAAASSIPQSTFAQRRTAVTTPEAKGYGRDPNLVKIYKPGAFWPLTFTPQQNKTATTLADIIIPSDKLGPAASEVGVVAYIDEWISAPYVQQQNDRPVIIDGLQWIDEESMRRNKKPLSALSITQQHAICDDICFTETAKPQFRKAAHFFSRFRTIAASAYYATPQGWASIGYVGNVILQKFDGPPAEVLKILDVTQTVP